MSFTQAHARTQGKLPVQCTAQSRQTGGEGGIGRVGLMRARVTILMRTGYGSLEARLKPGALLRVTWQQRKCSAVDAHKPCSECEDHCTHSGHRDEHS